MGRTYAGILGTLACLTTAARAMLAGTVGDATLLDAWWALLTMAAVGGILGSLASAAMEEAAHKQVEKEWAELKPGAGAPATTQ
jgi:membrane protein YqaA with SNARE-associated domain